MLRTISLLILKRSLSPVRLFSILRRFVAYSSVGVSTFLLDLGLIFLFVTYVNLHPTIAIGLGFLIAISINFFFSYHWVFRGTARRPLSGYLLFLSIALGGLGVVVGGTWLLHTILSLDLYLARILVAGFVGTMNFILNTFFNFKVY
jgi:putative flippase GtrA